MAPFMLVFEGSRTASSDTGTFVFGFRDEGSFSALAPMCDTGSAVDLENRLTDGWLTGVRRFDCGGGAGSIVARTWLLDGDPSLGYEDGAWLIVAGTGAYEGLRGKGTYVRAFLERESASIAELWAWSRRLRRRRSANHLGEDLGHDATQAGRRVPHSSSAQRSRRLRWAGHLPRHGEKQHSLGGEVRHRPSGNRVGGPQCAPTCR